MLYLLVAQAFVLSSVFAVATGHSIVTLLASQRSNTQCCSLLRIQGWSVHELTMLPSISRFLVSDVWRIPDEAVFDEMFSDLTQNVLLTRDDKSAFGKSVTSKHTYYSKSIKELGKKLYAGGLEEDTPK